MATVVIF